MVWAVDSIYFQGEITWSDLFNIIVHIISQFIFVGSKPYLNQTIYNIYVNYSCKHLKNWAGQESVSRRPHWQAGYGFAF